MTCRKMKSLLFHALVPAVLAVMLVPAPAFAAEECPVTIPVKVEVEATGNRTPEARPYQLVLEGITEGAPMPAETRLIIQGAGESAFGEILYRVPGDYQYRIYQNSEAAEYYEYDSRVYTVTVRIVRDEENNLSAQIWAEGSDSEEEKAGSITFANRYTRSGSSGGGGGGGGGGGTSGGGGSGSGGPGVAGDGLTEIGDETTPLAAGFPGAISEMIPETILDAMVPLAMLPQTGDTTSLGLWILLMVFSGCVLTGLLAMKRRIW